jgi:NAD(P)-dependent dehydrogenase (short-subunit alcohol dehydrogenase family)
LAWRSSRFSRSSAFRRSRSSVVSPARWSAHRGRMLAARYTASKHGVLAFTKAFATEWVS